MESPNKTSPHLVTPMAKLTMAFQVASRSRDLEIMQGQLKMAAMKSMKRAGSRRGAEAGARTAFDVNERWGAMFSVDRRVYDICIYIPREPITYEIIGRHAKPRLFCTFHQNPVYCVKTPGFPKNPNFWSEMLDMLTFWQNLALAFILDNNQTDAFQIYWPTVGFYHQSITILFQFTFHAGMISYKVGENKGTPTFSRTYPVLIPY